MMDRQTADHRKAQHINNEKRTRSIYICWKPFNDLAKYIQTIIYIQWMYCEGVIWQAVSDPSIDYCSSHLLWAHHKLAPYPGEWHKYLHVNIQMPILQIYVLLGMLMKLIFVSDCNNLHIITGGNVKLPRGKIYDCKWTRYMEHERLLTENYK